MNHKIDRIVVWLFFTIFLSFLPLLIKLYGCKTFAIELKTTELFSELFFADILLAMSSIQIMASRYEKKYLLPTIVFSLSIILTCFMCYYAILMAEYIQRDIDLKITCVCVWIMTPLSIIENIACFVISFLKYSENSAPTGEVEK